MYKREGEGERRKTGEDDKTFKHCASYRIVSKQNPMKIDCVYLCGTENVQFI